MTRRIVISGYYGFNNLGDEAVLAATVGELHRLVPDVEIAVLSAAPVDTSRAYGVRGIPRSDLATSVGVLRNCDLFLSGGGSLFQDATSWRSPWYYLALVAAARVLARHTMVYAQGIEPPHSRSVGAAMAFLLNGMDLITVRDVTSQAVLTGLGVRRPRVVLTADPSLLLTPDWSARVAAERARWGGGAWFGLAMRPWAGGEAVRAMGAAARITAQRLGIRWALLPMHRPGDLAACEALAADLGEAAAVVRAPLGPREMLALIGSLDLLVGMRLHALLFAAARGVPVVPIAYDPKVNALMRDLGGPPPLSVASLHSDEIIGAVEAAAAERSARRARLLAAVAPLRERAALAPALAADLIR